MAVVTVCQHSDKVAQSGETAPTGADSCLGCSLDSPTRLRTPDRVFVRGEPLRYSFWRATVPEQMHAATPTSCRQEVREPEGMNHPARSSTAIEAHAALKSVRSLETRTANISVQTERCSREFTGSVARGVVPW